MNLVYCDIETLPAQDAAVIFDMRAEFKESLANIKAPGNYKDHAKIAAYIENARSEAEAGFDNVYRRTSFDATRGEIFCICAALNDGDIGRWNRTDIGFPGPGVEASEYSMLSAFFAWFEEIRDEHNQRRIVTLVGHNGSAFDWPFIWRRAVILGVPVPASFPLPLDIRPWGDKAHDTMLMWTGSPKDGIRMDKLARCLGIQGKGGMDGSMVWDAVNEGRGQEVVDYCVDDVRMLREIYRKLTFAGGVAA